MTLFLSILVFGAQALWHIFVWACRALALSGAVALLWAAAYWLWMHA